MSDVSRWAVRVAKRWGRSTTDDTWLMSDTSKGEGREAAGLGPGPGGVVVVEAEGAGAESVVVEPGGGELLPGRT